MTGTTEQYIAQSNVEALQRCEAMKVLRSVDLIENGI